MILNKKFGFIYLGFWKYEVSTFGRIKSLRTVERRACPRTGVIKPYVRKETILRPLYSGIDKRWVGAKLSVKKGIHKQVSVAKLMLSAFLGIKMEDLPHSVYFKNKDSHDLRLHNLTFEFMKREM